MNFRKLKFPIIVFLVGLILGTYACRFVLMNIVVHTNDGIAPIAIDFGCIFGGVCALIGMGVAKFYK